MFIVRHFVMGFILCGLFASTVAFADAGQEKSAIYQMAEIMHRMKHYPSPQGKEVLTKITQASNSTENERVIATAMIDLEHHVADSDVPKLKAIIGNDKATAHERTLAKIILDFDHRPSKQDKAQLEEMMQ